MDFSSGVFPVAADGFSEILRSAHEQGIRVFTVHTRGKAGREPFFDAVRAEFPLDPPVPNPGGWEALDDSLWEGIRTMPVDRLVLVWPDSDSYRRDSPEDHRLALDVLDSVSSLLADERAMCAPAKTMSVFIAE